MPEKKENTVKAHDDGAISRREFIQKSAVLTGGLAAATTLLDLLGPTRSYADQVDPNDPALISTEVKFTSADGAAIGAYVTRPRGDGRRPAVIVIHDNAALDDHNRDVGGEYLLRAVYGLSPGQCARRGAAGHVDQDRYD